MKFPSLFSRMHFINIRFIFFVWNAISMQLFISILSHCNLQCVYNFSLWWIFYTISRLFELFPDSPYHRYLFATCFESSLSILTSFQLFGELIVSHKHTMVGSSSVSSYEWETRGKMSWKFMGNANEEHYSWVFRGFLNENNYISKKSESQQWDMRERSEKGGAFAVF